jgi:hypothetical protein
MDSNLAFHVSGEHLGKSAEVILGGLPPIGRLARSCGIVASPVILL